ncbi:MAG: hypothetical protein L3J51_00235 [Cocleimonas sp.]|nr:hypothetical protein [Cocleimonas sp.]
MTKEKSKTDIAENEFQTAFKGKFYGVLKWDQLDDLWKKIKNNKKEGWYVYAIGDMPPEKRVSGKVLETVINELNVLLRREHDEDYCGIVYTDSLTTPSFIKVFDPNNVGTSCSIAKTPPLPGWTISKLPPSDLLAPMKQTTKRKRWWDKMFSKSQ